MDATSSKNAAPHGKTPVEDSTEDESPPVPDPRRRVSDRFLQIMATGLKDEQVEKQNRAAVLALKNTFDSKNLKFNLMDDLFQMLEHSTNPHYLPIVLSLLDPERMELLSAVVAHDPGSDVLEATANSTGAVNQVVAEGPIGGQRTGLDLPAGIEETMGPAGHGGVGWGGQDDEEYLPGDSTGANKEVVDVSIGGQQTGTARSGRLQTGQPEEIVPKDHHHKEPNNPLDLPAGIEETMGAAGHGGLGFGGQDDEDHPPGDSTGAVNQVVPQVSVRGQQRGTACSGRQQTRTASRGRQQTITASRGRQQTRTASRGRQQTRTASRGRWPAEIVIRSHHDKEPNNPLDLPAGIEEMGAACHGGVGLGGQDDEEHPPGDSTEAVNQEVSEGSIGRQQTGTASRGGQQTERAHHGTQPAETVSIGHHDKEPNNPLDLPVGIEETMGAAGHEGVGLGGQDDEEHLPVDSTRTLNQKVPEGSIRGQETRRACHGGQPAASSGHHDDEPDNMGDAGQGGGGLEEQADGERSPFSLNHFAPSARDNTSAGHADGHGSEEESGNFGLTGTGAGEETKKYNGYGYHRLTPKTFHKEFVRFEGIHGDFKARHYCCMLLNVDSFEKLAKPPLTSLSELVLLHQIVKSPEDTVEEWALRDTTTEKLGQMYIVDGKVYGSVNAEGWTKSVYKLRGNEEWQVLVYTLDALSRNKADQMIEAVDAVCKRFKEIARIDDASTQTILGLLK